MRTSIETLVCVILWVGTLVPLFAFGAALVIGCVYNTYLSVRERYGLNPR